MTQMKDELKESTQPKHQFAFEKKNFILLAIGIVVVAIGLILMSGEGSTDTQFNPEIFSARRIKLAPAVCFFGYLFMVFAIMYRPSQKRNKAIEEQKEESTQQ